MGSLTKSLLLATAATLLHGVDVSRASILAGKVTNPSNGHDYYLLNQSTWTAAEAEAVAMGGHLATVRSASENAFIYDTFAPLVPAASQTRWLAIGLREIEDGTGWVWSSGEPFSYANWEPGQPDNNSGFDEDYGGIALPPLVAGLWHDVSETRPDNDLGWGVVEVVPEPGTLGAMSLAAFVVAAKRRRSS